MCCLISVQVKESMSTLKDSASSMNRLQKMQIKKSVKETDSAANWSADDIVKYVSNGIGPDKQINGTYKCY